MMPPRKPSYAGHRFPPEVIGHAVWLYCRFPLSLRMVEELLAARGITVSHETVRQWALKFGQGFANQIRLARFRRAGSATFTGFGHSLRLPCGIGSPSLKGELSVFSS